MACFFVLPRRLVCALVTLLLSLSPVLAQAQTRAPDLGDGLELSPAAERRLGDRVLREIEHDAANLDDPVLAEYLEALWQPLLAAARQRGDLTPELDSQFAWRLLLMRERSINAFALPGGYLGVNLGLIGLAATRDELAAVLGHELSHVTQRHLARLMAQQSRQAPWLLAALILGSLAVLHSPDAGQATIAGSQAVSAQAQLNFSRDMEREADRIGFGVMTQAGYDGTGVVALFDKLQKANRINDTGAFPYLRSHPLTTERIADAQLRLQARAAPAPVRPTVSPTLPDLEPALMAARARVLADPGIATLQEWLTQAENKSGSQATADAPMLYAASLAALRLREHRRAAVLAQRLVDQVASVPAARRQARLLQAELALARQDPAAALAVLESVPPPAPERPEALLRAQAQIQSDPAGRRGAAERASTALRLWLAAHPNDAQAWELLAAAWTAQAQPVAAMRAQAQAQAARMEYEAAVEQLKAAQEWIRKAGKAGQALSAQDEIEAAIVDSRLRELGLLLREQALQH